MPKAYTPPPPNSEQERICAVLESSGIPWSTQEYEGPVVFADGPKPGNFDLCSSQPGVRFDFDQDGKLLEIAIWH